MSSSFMNGRLRSVPTNTHGGSVVSALPITLQRNLSVCSIERPEPPPNDHSSSGTAAAHVPLRCPNEDIAGIYQSLDEGVPINNIAHHGEQIVDHCWWNIPPACGSKIRQQCCSCSSDCSQQSRASDGNSNECYSISILAVLVRCQANAPTLNHASSSSSIVRLYFHKNKDISTIDKNGVLFTSIPTSFHATSIAMGGKGLDGVLVIARSSGMELHRLQPILETYLEGHCQSCGELLKDSPYKSEKTMVTVKDEVEETAHLERTPPRSSNPMPTTPLAPKSLSKAFEDASQLMQSPQGMLKSPSLAIPNSTKSQIPPITSAHQPPTIHYQIQPIELLQSFCIHALHLSYPYLSVASGDRVGIWNVGCEKGKFTTREVEEALWTTTLPPHSKSVHRRVTSMCITPCGEAMALSCWDGSAFVYEANSPPRDSSCSSYPNSLITSWELVNEGGIIDSPASTTRSSPLWEQPTVNSDGLFPTFVGLRLNYRNICHGEGGNALFSARGQPGSLVMAVSTPHSDKIRCFDVFSGVQCTDIFLGENPCRGEIHGIVTASCSDSNAKDELVWVTEKDVIHSQQW
eukprot:CAMPEP_0172303558 /NCGR_PEP_ID=MMETSP1058-20130122/5084_1 /TAXON_ID=83371 /ORGANISM="Detonula confervacea, Strain CCMP 353" /LENGTH=575 /DNA_ID=CAMNT_0013014423 /DNA_START=76 /DNA_END=1800 /DNA_ORIENTATION=-